VVSKHTGEALLCYQEQAAQSGLAGETAQYELARLWRDSLGEPERALAAFKDQRSRFPSGALRIEADLSIIEILPRLGRHAEAMTETEQFLNDHPKAERRGEIRLLRGNIFREVLHDLDRAEREYARGAESGGRVGDDCRFLRAVCLEALGRVEEARKAYDAYLLGSKPAHVEEVKRRIEHLRP
jgi:tetratricopeptide (TPR) repeat protein